MKNFALLGAAGYIAPRHMKAIRDTGNRLIAAMDKHDAVGIMDGYFPDSAFFVEFERLDRHVEKLRRLRYEKQIHYVSIASPNYLHDAHIRFALRIGADAICEKPLVLNPWNVDALKQIEKESGRKVNTILQLRLHRAIVALWEKYGSLSTGKKVDIDLTYVTSRGKWYLVSWKGDISKSGGVATNIGIHFFDMLRWIFGDVRENIVHLSQPTRAAGYLELERARIRWLLSLDPNDLPAAARNDNKTTYRSITIDGNEIEFSEGFTDLHTDSYRQILSGNGYGLDDAKPSIEIAFAIRNANPIGIKGEYHPFLKVTNTI
jgi:UDP-N-acetyl-2-amino-2-deoxyglucuronate dehydrogenase